MPYDYELASLYRPFTLIFGMLAYFTGFNTLMALTLRLVFDPVSIVILVAALLALMLNLLAISIAC